MGWSDMPPELLVTIAGMLTERTDQIRFRCVCVSWRSAFKSLPLPPQLPWLILPSDSFSDPHRFYSFSEDRIYSIPLQEAGISYLYGSSNGWVLTLEGKYPQLMLSLINSFTGASVNLPSPDVDCSLSNGHNSTLICDCSDSVVVAACSIFHDVYYYRFGNDSWSEIEYLQDCVPNSIVFFSDNFYILKDRNNEISILDKDTLEEISVIDPLFVDDSFHGRFFMSSGELMLFLKPRYTQVNNNKHHKIFQVSINEKRWIEVSDFGEHALFVDDCRCISIK